MAAAVAQYAIGRTSNGTSVTTAAINTAGSGRTFLVVASDAGDMSTPTDNKSNTYTALGSGNSNAGNLLRAWICVNGTGGSGHQATGTKSSAGYPSMLLLEISGALTSGANDSGAYNQGGDDFTPYTLTTTGASLAQADNLVVGAFTHNNSGTTDATVGSPFTMVGQESDSTQYWPLAVASRNTSATDPVTVSFERTNPGMQTGLLIIVIKSAAGGSIVEADATITGASTDAFEGQKLLAMLAAVDAASTDAYLGSKVLGGDTAQTATSTDAWVGTGVSAGVVALTASSTDAYVSGSILSAVWAAVGDVAALFESNAIASAEGDFAALADAEVLFVGTGVAGAAATFDTLAELQMLRGAIIAADFAMDGELQGDWPATAIRSGVAQLVADAIVAWQTGYMPGDGGSTNPASILRRMRRDGQLRSMTSARPARKMTR